ncbi:MAG TPA: hypothetical protein VNM15_06135 [Candidatus Binatia bacterium]|nr:hypothetical protein [Candidatus Binatia bacterium]
MTLGIINASDFADALRAAFEKHDRANLERLMTEFNIADHGVTKRREIKFAAAPMSQERPATAAQKRHPPAALQKPTLGAKRRRKTTPILFWLFFAASSRLLASESATEVAAAGRAALKHRDLGLFAARDFDLTTGKCADCPTPKQVRWYFENDLIAVPKNGLPVAGLVAERNGYDAVVRALKTHRAEKALSYPPAVWIGAKDLLEHASVSADGKTLTTSGGNALPLELVPRLATNRSYFDRSSAAFFSRRSLRIRGETNRSSATPGFVARTIWPEDFRIRADALARQPLRTGEEFSRLIAAGSAQGPFETRLLWERSEANRDWAGLPVLALVLSGAQGDDDESQAGHIAVATGRVGPQGEMADWLVNNFYNLDEVSEKGIIASMVPLDNYLADLNSGQSYYRPVYMLVAVLKDSRVATRFQAAIESVYNHFYRHDFSYHHSKSNCTGITMDALRALGWHIPRRGPTGYLKAAAALAYLSIIDGSFSSGKKMFDYLSEEKTRLFPRAAFEAAGEDLLGILSGQIKRHWTDYERALRDDAVAVLFVRVPQIPSSRAFGTYPVASLEEYRNRLPADRSQWRTVPVDPRPFPDGLRDPLPRETSLGAWGYLAASIAGLAFFGSAARLIFRRRFTKGNLS